MKTFGKLYFNNEKGFIKGLNNKIGEGREAIVYQDPEIESRVIKFYYNQIKDIDAFLNERNSIPLFAKLELAGQTTNGYPAFYQKKYVVCQDFSEQVQRFIRRACFKAGWKITYPMFIHKDGQALMDLCAKNIGIDVDGNPVIIDAFIC